MPPSEGRAGWRYNCEERRMTRIVVLGPGIAGSMAAFEIKHVLGDKAEVTAPPFKRISS